MLLSRWALLTALTLIGGALTVRWLVLPRVELGQDLPSARRSLATLGLGSAGFLVAALGATLWMQFASFRDPFAPATEDLSLLLSTPWGTAWKAALSGSILLLLAFVRARGEGVRTPRPLAWLLATILAIALAFFPSFTGHAAAEGMRAQVADGIHVLAAGSWMGSLAALLLLVRTAEGRVARLLRARALLPVFTPVALTGAALLGLTGGYASWLHLPGPSALLTSDYGRILLGKLALVAGIAALGAWNWKRMVPALTRDDEAVVPPRQAILEAGLGLAVLLVTAWLVLTSPPMGG